MADRVGQQLGNYRLSLLLGRGGFAEVYLGEHLRLGTQAAVKVLYTRLASRDDVEGFEMEARTVAHLKHPHIVRVLDYDVEEDTPFLVMDYALGGTLRHRHPKGTRLPLTTIISYVKQVADALQYAHDHRVIHRDIKPENMLVGEHDELLLSDFGIAIVAQSSRYQSTQNIGGTMAYIAPEQIQGHPRIASDQYSLGIVVYEWLSGICPFHGSLTEIVAQHLAVPPPSLREKIPTIPRDVEQVVFTALAKDPSQRFASIQAFAKALEQACQIASSHRVALPAEVIILNEPSLAIDETAARSPSQSPSPTNVITPSSQSLPPTVTATPIHDPNVSPLFIREPKSPSEPSRRAIVVRLVGLVVVGSSITWLALSQRSQVTSPIPSSIGATLYTYRGHANDVKAVTWSPDGKHIASASSDFTVQVWDAATGKRHVTYSGHTNIVCSVAWSPDGKFIASGGSDDVQVWDAMTGKPRLTYTGHHTVQIYPGLTKPAVYSVVWSPDGKSIASGSLVNSVQAWDAMTGNTRLTYTEHHGPVLSVAWSPDGKSIASASEDRTVQVWEVS